MLREAAAFISISKDHVSWVQFMRTMLSGAERTIKPIKKIIAGLIAIHCLAVRVFTSVEKRSMYT